MSQPTRLACWSSGLLLVLLIGLASGQQAPTLNRRAQNAAQPAAPAAAASVAQTGAASGVPPPQTSSAASANNQALRSSSQQRSSQQQSAQATRKPVNQAPTTSRRPLDPDAEPDDDSAPGAPDVIKFECPRPDGLFADPQSCKRFILCGSSHPWQQVCPPGLYFDSKLKFCTFKSATLTCGPVSDEEENRQEEAIQESQDSLPTCDAKCRLPDCFCSADGSQVPGGLTSQQVPQMVVLSFSGAVNELVFDHYKRILGYSTKLGSGQSRLNPNGCGIRSTFFVSHEYTSYAQIHWLAVQGHELGLHSISHRLPELWWTDKANYSDWVEEMVGMREILLQLTNINGDTPVIKREDVVGLRAPYVKPGGDPMYQMINDFGLSYSSSLVAPKTEYPLWPFTLDSKVPFDCANTRHNKPAVTPASDRASERAASRPGRTRRGELAAPNDHQLTRHKRQSTFAGKALKCATKPYPGIWEIPLNPLTNDLSACHHLDQCVFPTQDDHQDSSDIFDFLVENFERHYNTTRAPFQINVHVQWVLNAGRVRALTKFIDHVSKAYPNTWFVSFKQMLDWVRNPVPATQAANVFKCDEPGKVKVTACNRPQTCVVKLNIDNENRATTQEQSKRSDARYLQICPGVTCPKAYPWFGNLLGTERNLRTVLELVQESSADSSSSGGAAPAAAPTTTAKP